MKNENLSTYLNDHLGGSVAGLELVENLEETFSDSDLKPFFQQLREEIEADQEDLRSLMKRLNIEESSTRKASGWIAEKMTQLKLRLDDPATGALRLFESLEALSLGIEGKRSLWIALSTAARVSTSLQLLDYEHMALRAQEQRGQVEKLRIDCARKALVADNSGQ